MFIRDDLLDKIKEIYGTEKFLYTSTEQDVYGNVGTPFLIFTIDKKLIAITKNAILKNVYNLEFAARDRKDGRCYLCNHRYYVILEVEGNETILTKVYSNALVNSENSIEYKFPGIAFNFDQEFVVAALENTQVKDY